MSEVRRAAEAARDAAQHVATLTTEQKNDYLRDLAGALVAAEEDILRANAADIARSEEDGLSTPKYEAARLLFERVLAARGYFENASVNLTTFDDLVGLLFAYRKLGMDTRAVELEQALVPYAESLEVQSSLDARRKAHLAAARGDRGEAIEWIRRSVELGAWQWWVS